MQVIDKLLSTVNCRAPLSVADIFAWRFRRHMASYKTVLLFNLNFVVFLLDLLTKV